MATQALSGTSTHSMILRSNSQTTRPPRKPKQCEKTKEIAKTISTKKDVDSTPQTKRTYHAHYKGERVNGRANGQGEMIIPENECHNDTCEKMENCLISFFNGEFKDGKPVQGMAYIQDYDYQGAVKDFKLNGEGTLTYMGHPPVHKKVLVYSKGYFKQNVLMNGYEIHQSFFERIKIDIVDGKQQNSFIQFFNGDTFEGSTFGFNPSLGHHIFVSPNNNLDSFHGSYLLGIPQRGKVMFKNGDEWDGFVSDKFLPDDIGIYRDNNTLSQSIHYLEKGQLKFKVELTKSTYRYHDLNDPYKSLVIDYSTETPQYYWQIYQTQIIPLKSTFTEENIDRRLFEGLIELKTNDENILKTHVRFENGVPCFGIIEYHQGHKYYGGLCNSKGGILPHGEGKLFFSNSDLQGYEGIFHKGIFKNGTAYCTNGDIHVGQQENYRLYFNKSKSQSPLAIIATECKETDSSYLINLFANGHFTFARIANEDDIEPKGTILTICEYHFNSDGMAVKTLP